MQNIYLCQMQEHEKYMQRCIDLAYLGLGHVRTNPMVGSVIVHKGKIVGEGYHQKFAQAHAEVNAIKDVQLHYPDANAILKESTLYVNLEPCAHYGKTPPCTDLIIQHQIPRVVIANSDPFAQVNGKGIQKLKDAGIEVIYGILETKGRTLNKRFFCRIQKQRPFIILKWAETTNGFFAPKDETQKWISSPIAKKLVHQWRSQEAAVLVGFKTTLIDNPQLNVREMSGTCPIRVLIDPSLEIPATHHLLDQSQKTLIFNNLKTDFQGNNQYIQIPEPEHYFFEKILYQLYLADINSIIIEGGKKTLDYFIEKGLWDEARIFSSKHISWQDGIKAPEMKHKHFKNSHDLGDDILNYFQNETL